MRSVSCEQMSIDILPRHPTRSLPSLSAMIFEFLLIHNIDAHQPSAPSTDLVRSSKKKKGISGTPCFSDDSSLACMQPCGPSRHGLSIHTDSGLWKLCLRRPAAQRGKIEKCNRGIMYRVAKRLVGKWTAVSAGKNGISNAPFEGLQGPAENCRRSGGRCKVYV